MDRARDGNGSTSNNGACQAKYDGEFWYRQDLTAVRSSANNSSSLSKTKQKRGGRWKNSLKPAKSLQRSSITLFVCVVVFGWSARRADWEYDAERIVEAEWENAFLRQPHDGSNGDGGISSLGGYSKLTRPSVDGQRGTVAMGDVAGFETAARSEAKLRSGSGGIWKGLHLGKKKKYDGTLGTRGNEFDHRIRNDEGSTPIGEDVMEIQRPAELNRPKGESEEDAYFANQLGGFEHAIIQKHETSRLSYSPGIPLPDQHVQEKIDFLSKDLKKKKFKPTKQLLNQIKTSPHIISGLDCILYNGPRPTACQDLVYWKDIPYDSDSS